MKEKLIEALGTRLNEFNCFIDSVNLTTDNNGKVLEVVIDRDNELIDLQTIVKITRILNPIIDKIGLSKDIDTLDVYAKEKGEVENE